MVLSCPRKVVPLCWFSDGSFRWLGILPALLLRNDDFAELSANATDLEEFKCEAVQPHWDDLYQLLLHLRSTLPRSAIGSWTKVTQRELASEMECSVSAINGQLHQLKSCGKIELGAGRKGRKGRKTRFRITNESMDRAFIDQQEDSKKSPTTKNKNMGNSLKSTRKNISCSYSAFPQVHARQADHVRCRAVFKDTMPQVFA